MKPKGFSLFEVIVTLILISIITSLVIPKFTVYLQKKEIELARRQVQNKLQSLRFLAISKNYKTKIIFLEKSVQVEIIAQNSTQIEESKITENQNILICVAINKDTNTCSQDQYMYFYSSGSASPRSILIQNQYYFQIFTISLLNGNFSNQELTTRNNTH
ncbi:MAG: prepilin-type N-terminal cleavage/methylation domain-containing protein [bacterium]|jgi:prepilin-type N-terminal cleavage/methylation domain-containing protein